MYYPKEVESQFNGGSSSSTQAVVLIVRSCPARVSWWIKKRELQQNSGLLLGGTEYRIKLTV
jgi:hypothetical protein